MKRNYNVKNEHPLMFLFLSAAIVLSPLVVSATDANNVNSSTISPAMRAESVRNDNAFAPRPHDTYVEQDHNNPVEDNHNTPVTGASNERSYSPSYNVNDRM